MRIHRSRISSVRLLALSALMILSASCGFIEKDAVKTRVQAILDGIMKDDMSNEYQAAVMVYSKGVEFSAGQSEMDQKIRAFENWLRQKEIMVPVSEATLQTIEMESKGRPYSATVIVVINGRTLRMKVVEGQMIKWL